MNQLSLENRLETASDVAGVLAIARAYLATFSPDELASLPEPCRPPARLVDIDDVNSYAFELAWHHCGDSEHAELLEELAAFFSHAATRTSKLLAYRQREIEARSSG